MDKIVEDNPMNQDIFAEHWKQMRGFQSLLVGVGVGYLLARRTR